MNNRIVTSLCILCAILSAIQRASAQGALSPTAAPAPTMKTLAQIEPRTPISALPATITASGSYYITTNLTGIAGGTNGITILANDVSLDLCGFTLLGVAGSGSGISAPNSERNLAIHNGAVDSWVGAGVAAMSAYNSQLESLRISNSGYGLYAGSNCVVSACLVSANMSGGMQVGNNCIVKDCTAIANGIYNIFLGNNCIVKDCAASGNAFYGIEVGTACQVIGNLCTSNTEAGIGIYGVQTRVDGNYVGNNGVYGVLVSFENVTNCITRNFAPGNGGAPYSNYAGNNDYAPTGSVSTATNPWTNF
jgi:hypothetical protein